MLYLRVEGPDGESQELSLTGPEISIGRAPDNEVHLPDASVSKRHARIVIKDGRMILVDLKSTNGTFVNGRRLLTPQVIRWSDAIGLGNFVLRFSESSELPPARRAVDGQPSAAPPRPAPLFIGAGEPPLGARADADALRADLPVAHVEVFRHGALITRRGTVDASGDVTIEVRDLPLALLDDSLRVAITADRDHGGGGGGDDDSDARGAADGADGASDSGADASDTDDSTPSAAAHAIDGGATEAQVVDVHVGLQLELADDDAPIPEVAELERLRRRITRLDERRSRLTIEVGQLLELRPALPEPPVDNDKARFAADDPVPAWLSLARCAREEAERRQAQVQALDTELRDLTEQLAKAEEAVTAASTARRNPRDVRKVARVRVRGASGSLELELDYQVPGARWYPTYELRVDEQGGSAELLMSALIAQCTGEDWDAVPLALSTADLARNTRTPELGSWRIGRTQRERPRAGWRPLPQGLDALFSDFDRSLPPTPSPKPVPPLVLPGAIAGALAAAPEEPDDFAVSELLQAPLQTPGDFEPSSTTPATITSHTAPRDDQTGELVLQHSVPEVLTGELASVVFDADDELEFFEDQESPFDDEQTHAEVADLNLLDERRERRITTAVEAGAPPRQRAAAPTEFAGAAAPGAAPAGSATHRAVSAPPDGASAGETGSSRPIAPSSELLSYEALVVSAAHESRRGVLRSRRPDELLPPELRERSEAESAVQLGRFASERDRQNLDQLALPPGAVSVSDSAGHFAYRYFGRVCDVPSDGSLHRVAVTRSELPARVSYRTVPVVDTAVFRLATLDNPLDSPLLAGPLDVFWGSDFLVTTRLDTTAPGASIEASLGVEPHIKVARNVSHSQHEKGLLSGKTVYEDVIEIEIASSLGRPVSIDVIERVPVSDDRKVDIDIRKETPAAEPFEQKRPIRGGRRFHLELGAGGRAGCTLHYRVTLPSGSDIVGGGRRAG